MAKGGLELHLDARAELRRIEHLQGALGPAAAPVQQRDRYEKGCSGRDQLYSQRAIATLGEAPVECGQYIAKQRRPIELPVSGRPAACQIQVCLFEERPEEGGMPASHRHFLATISQLGA